MNDQEFKEKYDKLKNSKFYQQKMLGWRPLPTISCITIIFVSNKYSLSIINEKCSFILSYNYIFYIFSFFC